MSLIEVSRGTCMVIDYGSDHAFSNSFRGIKNHKIIKDFKEISDKIGTIDLTGYVNFAQIKKLAESNKSCKHFTLLFIVHSACKWTDTLGLLPGKHGHPNETRDFAEECQNRSLEETSGRQLRAVVQSGCHG